METEHPCTTATESLRKWSRGYAVCFPNKPWKLWNRAVKANSQHYSLQESPFRNTAPI